MSSLRSRVNAELAALADLHGTLKQQQVVEAAREAGTALHEQFACEGLWDEAVAAERARLEFAGRLIRLYTVRLTEDQRAPVRALVSLIEDRTLRSGLPGYRRIEQVLGDEGLRENMLQTALMELRACRRKYLQLQELAEIWDVIDKVDQRRKPQPEVRIGT